ncbi:MAG: M42 family metallopeptidase [Candidatus Zixiibacteriota bacterium]
MEFSLLRKLMDTPGVSGNETKIRNIIAEEIKPYVDDIKVDRIGDIIAHKKGNGPRVLLIAHMDEVGYMVKDIDDNGFIKVIAIGGIDPRVFYAQRVIVHGREDIRGIVGATPPHLLKGKDSRDKTIPLDKCFVDIGMEADDVKELVRPGDIVTFDVQSWENDISLFGKALDDRIGCFVMIEALKAAEKLDCDLYIAGSVQEERGMKGASPVATAVQPDIAIALEGTFAADVPGIPDTGGKSIQGKGPEIRLTDRAMMSHRGLVENLMTIGDSKEIDYQLAVKDAGATDAAAIHSALLGAQVTGIAIPCRYIHAPCGIARKYDIEQMVKLITEFIQQKEFSIKK